MRSILHLLPVLVVFPVLADEPQPGRQRPLTSTTYEIRDFGEKADTLTLLGLTRTASGENPPLATAEPGCKAALVVQALLSAIDPPGGKPTTVGIEVINGNRLVIRADAATHTRIAETLQ